MKNVIDIKRKRLDEIRELILKGYSLLMLPDESKKLIYLNEKTKDVVLVKFKFAKYDLPPIKKQEAIESFEAYKLDEKDGHYHNEVGKLVALTGAALPGREEMLIYLRSAFNPKIHNINAESLK